MKKTMRKSGEKLLPPGITMKNDARKLSAWKINSERYFHKTKKSNKKWLQRWENSGISPPKSLSFKAFAKTKQDLVSGKGCLNAIVAMFDGCTLATEWENRFDVSRALEAISSVEIKMEKSYTGIAFSDECGLVAGNSAMSYYMDSDGHLVLQVLCNLISSHF